jgi:hypothetical protein
MDCLVLNTRQYPPRNSQFDAFYAENIDEQASSHDEWFSCGEIEAARATEFKPVVLKTCLAHRRKSNGFSYDRQLICITLHGISKVKLSLCLTN